MLQWSERVDELNRAGIKLIMISIGTPENGAKLVDHLEISNLRDNLYLDPSSSLYDSLKLNKGIKSTFFSAGTPFAFLNRFTTRGGTRELNIVLSKWNKAIYIPPRQDQALYQGGTFLFDGEKVVFAHFDESTGAHCDIQEVIDLANQTLKIYPTASSSIGV